MMSGCGGDDNDNEVPVVKPEDNNDKPDNNKPSKDSVPKEVELVDLGLSVKWASMNVGATSVEDYGDLYAWGETEPKSTYTKANYQHKNVHDDGIIVESAYYAGIGQEATIDIDGTQYATLDISGTQYDVAHNKWGGKWRIPTYKELKELKDDCTWEWALVDKAHKGKVQEWESFYGIDFVSNEVYFGPHVRFWGFSIRPVSD